MTLSLASTQMVVVRGGPATARVTTLYLIDALPMVYRAHYSFKTPLVNSKGVETHVAEGVNCSQLETVACCTCVWCVSSYTVGCW